MMQYLITAIFVLTLAITSGGILVSSHLKTTYKADFLSSLLFFQVFWFTFGFYTIWGQLVIAFLLASFVEPELLTKISSVIVVLGLPFLVFAWLMILRLTREISGRKTTGFFNAFYLSVNILLIPGIGYLMHILQGVKVFIVVKYGFILISFIYTILGSYYLLSGKKKQIRLRYADMKNIAFGLLLIMFVQNAVLFFHESNIYFTVLFIFAFYVYGGFMPVYLRYKTDLSKLLMQNEINISFDKFCEKFEISKREKEIIHEICNGLTNQQIADKLFISLQTVKDHTHRIYSKSNCNSRTNLICMVNESL